MNGADPEGSISRREFEGAIEQLGRSIAELKVALDKRNPGLANWLTIAAMVASVFYFGVTNSSRLEAVEEWKVGHESFSASKSDELERGIASLLATVSRNSEALKEQEMQHRWMADVTNLQDQRIEQLLRLHHPEIPASDYWPLQQIGQSMQPAQAGEH